MVPAGLLELLTYNVCSLARAGVSPLTKEQGQASVLIRPQYLLNRSLDIHAETNQIRDWIKPADVDSLHVALLPKRSDVTRSWIFGDLDYQRWRSLANSVYTILGHRKHSYHMAISFWWLTLFRHYDVYSGIREKRPVVRPSFPTIQRLPNDQIPLFQLFHH